MSQAQKYCNTLLPISKGNFIAWKNISPLNFVESSDYLLASPVDFVLGLNEYQNVQPISNRLL